MKEKIWVEKLIELLNEFETPQSWIVFKSYDDYDGTFYWVDCDGETEVALSDSFICGKRYQWVEWLVENDKIDFDGIQNVFYRNKRYKEYRDYSDYESLLMLLAIQDEPIRFLCEMLK